MNEASPPLFAEFEGHGLYISEISQEKFNDDLRPLARISERGGGGNNLIIINYS